MKTFTIEEIRNYILSQNSLGDAAYFLSEEAIERANSSEEDVVDDEDNIEEE